MTEPAPVSTARPESAPARPGAAGILARTLVALAAFVGVVLALRAVAAPAGGGLIGGKLEFWREHGTRYDTVFLGSSHALRAFVPAEFDRTAGELGVEARSFNFGVQAVHLLEQRYLLLQILDAHPGLARVFLEYQWLTPQIDPQNAFLPRSVYWHDGETTRLAVDRALHWGRELGDAFPFVEGAGERHALFTVLERPLPGDLRVAAQHVEHWLTDLFLIGRGKDVLRGLSGYERSERYGDAHGYLSLEEHDRALVAQGEERNSYCLRRERFLAGQAAYLRAVDELDAAEQAFADEEWMDAELLRVDDFELVARIATEVRARGVELVLVIMPSQSGNRPFEERLQEELGALVLRYNLPERYPALYDPANRWDSGHLSAEGALYFSRLLARDYAGQRGRERDGKAVTQ